MKSNRKTGVCTFCCSSVSTITLKLIRYFRKSSYWLRSATRRDDGLMYHSSGDLMAAQVFSHWLVSVPNDCPTENATLEKVAKATLGKVPGIVGACSCSLPACAPWPIEIVVCRIYAAIARAAWCFHSHSRSFCVLICFWFTTTEISWFKIPKNMKIGTLDSLMVSGDQSCVPFTLLPPIVGTVTW